MAFLLKPKENPRIPFGIPLRIKKNQKGATSTVGRGDRGDDVHGWSARQVGIALAAHGATEPGFLPVFVCSLSLVSLGQNLIHLAET